MQNQQKQKLNPIYQQTFLSNKCTCNSAKLYSDDYDNPDLWFRVDGIKHLCKRRHLSQQIHQGGKESDNNNEKGNLRRYQHQQHEHRQQKIRRNKVLIDSLLQTSQLWLPLNQIPQIEWEQVEQNPLWFYKNFIGLNKPCKIVNSLKEQDQIIENWSSPKHLQEKVSVRGDASNNISVSLTPNGFADSIMGQFFIQPDQIQTSISKFLNYQEELPGAIPYIQHQNNSLIEELSQLHKQVNPHSLNFITQQLFSGMQPDAQNFWMGYDQSVSALHKDPYENFYTTIVGEKHFTLLPPLDILFLEEVECRQAKWKYHKDLVCADLQQMKNGICQKRTSVSSFSLKQGYSESEKCQQFPPEFQLKNHKHFTCQQTHTTSSSTNTTLWIACNPDLPNDLLNTKEFPQLSCLHKFHVKLQKGDMLYLPSMWYHQVSQQRGKHDPYIVAINYWFDMEFTHGYSLYQMCRKLKGLK